MADVIENLLGEEVPVSEALEEMSKPVKEYEETIVIRGQEIPKRIYNLCVTHYLAIQYGDKDL